MRTLDDKDSDRTGAESGESADSAGSAETAVAGLFAARYLELVRLAGLLGADDPEDIAQEAFARLLRSYGSLRDGSAALAYVRDGLQPDAQPAAAPARGPAADAGGAPG